LLRPTALVSRRVPGVHDDDIVVGVSRENLPARRLGLSLSRRDRVNSSSHLIDAWARRLLLLLLLLLLWTLLRKSLLSIAGAHGGVLVIDTLLRRPHQVVQERPAVCAVLLHAAQLSAVDCSLSGAHAPHLHPVSHEEEVALMCDDRLAERGAGIRIVPGARLGDD
jgi:hypothetical protein